MNKISRGDFMKIALPTKNGGLDDEVSQIFGRAPSFTMVQIEEKEIKDHSVINNQHAQSASGAGVQAAQMLVNEGVQAVIGGNFGPNLASVLNQAGVKLYQFQGGTVSEAVEGLIEDQLQEVSGATGPAHGGLGGGAGRSSSGRMGGGQGGGMSQSSSGNFANRPQGGAVRDSSSRSSVEDKSGLTENKEKNVQNEQLRSLNDQVKKLEDQLSEIRKKIEDLKKG